jgi:hypothetical protein
MKFQSRKNLSPIISELDTERQTSTITRRFLSFLFSFFLFFAREVGGGAVKERKNRSENF